MAIKFIFHFTLKILDQIFKTVTDRLRFSITFKITVTYVLLFILLFSMMNIGIIISFSYYIRNGATTDYLYILSTILAVFSLIGIIIIALAGAKASKRLLAPLDAMTKTVKEISINALDKRLDISGSKDELKDLAKTFNEMLDRLQKSVEQQNRFISDASHELRTPISVIQGYANLLDRWGKDDPQVLAESISAIKSEAQNMHALVEGLLFLARGDNNTQQVVKENFPLHDLIAEVLKETRLISTAHQIINTQNAACTINADRKLIKEAIRIFLDNSIKYTPAGGTIKLNLCREQNSAVISIEDTGSGIAAADLPHIFERFYRADKSRTKQSGGTGLGLPIAKWIIDRHNGKIDVWSEVGVGTAVRVKLPL